MKKESVWREKNRPDDFVAATYRAKLQADCISWWKQIHKYAIKNKKKEETEIKEINLSDFKPQTINS